MTGKAGALTAEIRDVADPELAAAWRDLYARSLEPNIFLDPDFARPALAYLRPRGLKMMAVFETGAEAAFGSGADRSAKSPVRPCTRLCA